MNFEAAFRELTKKSSSFPWQRCLFERFVEGNIPEVCDIPTGLGKTSVIALWLLALGKNSPLPRRLAYVVNRRTIVDQATDVACDIRDAVSKALNDSSDPLNELAQNLRFKDPFSSPGTTPLAISTLRGEMADNQEWKTNPTKPAIIIGTVDMIGSKLLFSGYGDSRRTRPLHAGFLGCDCLFVHDEAHLTPAFGKLLRSVQAFRSEDHDCVPKFHVLELSATHTKASDANVSVFELSGQDEAHSTIQKRLGARKTLHLHRVDNDKDPLRARIVDLATAHDSSACRIVVFVREPETAQKIAAWISEKLASKAQADWEAQYPSTKLPSAKRKEFASKASVRVTLLTGQIRGYERDGLLERPGMQPFLGKESLHETVYLVATSAAEVGMDLHADHMVSDLSTLDSMIQRLGRVNRFGQGDARVDVVHPGQLQKSAGDSVEILGRTLELLTEWGGETEAGADVSLATLKQRLRAPETREAFTALPEMVDVTPILLDLWAQTSLDHLTARPEPEAWLHGLQKNYPHTFIAWRKEIQYFGEATKEDIAGWFNAHPILASERLQLPTHTITKTGKGGKSVLLSAFSDDRRESPVIIISGRREIRLTTLGDLIDRPGAYSLNYATIIFPAALGGLTEAGFFDPRAAAAAKDVADPKMCRCLLARTGLAWSYSLLNGSDEPATADLPWERPSASIRQIEQKTQLKTVRRLMVKKADESADEDEQEEQWLLLLSPRQTRASASAESPQTIDEHNGKVECIAKKLGETFGLPASIIEALERAARHHDDGKAAPRWQRAAGHEPSDSAEPLAKGAVDWRKLDGYRHEAGSLISASTEDSILAHPEKDLILHLIATHHGWARPGFKAEAFAVEAPPNTAQRLTMESMLRYDRLQRRFGWWGLAWLESLLRRADAMASETAQAQSLEEDES
ncbi:MAG: type I-G CRISPR-associated helicase/endonuclease Cas3g [Candidatus Hydrogenedentales bacterium]|jgi:CRISPR-associated endonuclease/helicase Cas3